MHGLGVLGGGGFAALRGMMMAARGSSRRTEEVDLVDDGDIHRAGEIGHLHGAGEVLGAGDLGVLLPCAGGSRARQRRAAGSAECGGGAHATGQRRLAHQSGGRRRPSAR